MPLPKCLEWNQLQLKIAKLLIENKMTPKQIAATGLCKYGVAYKIKQHIKKGEKPHSLDDDFIAKAPNPDSPIFNELKSLITKTAGVAETLQSALAPVADRISMHFVLVA